jgi:RimJ/RimL family protein N-acetyltransferase
MDFTLRPLTPTDAPALQAVYDAAPAAFAARFGQAAPPGQAAADLEQAAAASAEGETGRYQFGIYLEGTLIGLADCKLAPGAVESDPATAHIGLLLLAQPYDDPEITGLALRILTRWLARDFGVRRLAVDVPASAAAEVAFWRSQGFTFTGEQHRREIGHHAPRFLVMSREEAK